MPIFMVPIHVECSLTKPSLFAVQIVHLGNEHVLGAYVSGLF